MNRRLLRLLLMCAVMLPACGFPRPPDVAECNAAADCKSAAAPFCVAGACSAACGSNDDCAGRTDAPLCDVTAGACVGCLDSTSCTSGAPVCDSVAHSCRGCGRDDECASGVCLEADGRCAMTDEIVFLQPLNSSDNPACSATMPCRTFAGALAAITPQRAVIHVIGGTLSVTKGIDLSGRRLYIDGSDTVVFNEQPPSDATPTFAVNAAGSDVTLGRMKVLPSAAAGAVGVAVSNNGAMHLAIVETTASVSGGSLDADLANIRDVTCLAGGTLTIARSILAAVTTTNCTADLRANRFGANGVDPLVRITGGKFAMENNLILASDAFTDPVDIRSAVAGSRFAFNTMVNFSGLDGTATVMFCDRSFDVSSNVFAWHSSATLAPECMTHDSLFDEFVPADQVGNNHQANAAAIFADLHGKDLHLSGASPALGLGEPGVVDADIEGKPRPNPTGTRPDVGAYESP